MSNTVPLCWVAPCAGLGKRPHHNGPFANVYEVGTAPLIADKLLAQQLRALSRNGQLQHTADLRTKHPTGLSHKFLYPSFFEIAVHIFSVLQGLSFGCQTMLTIEGFHVAGGTCLSI